MVSPDAAKSGCRRHLMILKNYRTLLLSQAAPGPDHNVSSSVLLLLHICFTEDKTWYAASPYVCRPCRKHLRCLSESCCYSPKKDSALFAAVTHPDAAGLWHLRLHLHCSCMGLQSSPAQLPALSLCLFEAHCTGQETSAVSATVIFC